MKCALTLKRRRYLVNFARINKLRRNDALAFNIVGFAEACMFLRPNVNGSYGWIWWILRYRALKVYTVAIVRQVEHRRSRFVCELF